MKLVHTLSVLATIAGVAIPSVASADPMHGGHAVPQRGGHGAVVSHERRAWTTHERREWIAPRYEHRWVAPRPYTRYVGPRVVVRPHFVHPAWHTPVVHGRR